jgi:hypothetical protein
VPHPFAGCPGARCLCALDFLFLPTVGDIFFFCFPTRPETNG